MAPNAEALALVRPNTAIGREATAQWSPRTVCAITEWGHPPTRDSAHAMLVTQPDRHEGMEPWYPAWLEWTDRLCRWMEPNPVLVLIDDAVYGAADDGPSLRPETEPVIPSLARAEWRLSAMQVALEAMVMARAGEGHRIALLRTCALIGPGLHQASLPRRWARELLYGPMVSLPARGTVMRTWCSVEDATRVALALLGVLEPGVVYQLGGPMVASDQEMASLIATALGVPMRPIRSPVPGLDDCDRMLDGWSAAVATGIEPTGSIEAAIDRMVAEAKEDGR